VLLVVNKSPDALEKRCKQSWLNIFGPRAMVNGRFSGRLTSSLGLELTDTWLDPVGTPLHKGPAELSRFYDCFIASNSISFDVKQDLVDEDAQRVIRVTDIFIRFQRSSNYGMIQPAHIVYDVDPTTKSVKSLKAAWQLNEAKLIGSSWSQFLGSFMLFSYAFLPVIFYFGPIFSLRYIWGLVVGLVSGGRRLARNLLLSVERADESLFEALFYRPDSSCVRIGTEFMRPHLLWKTFWNGTTRFEILDSNKSSGWRTTIYYKRELASGETKLGYAELDVLWQSPLSSAIETLYIYEQDDASAR
jgi:hypothetical protein